MFRFIEKSFLKITQVVSLLFATVVLIMAVTLGYNKIDIKGEKTDVPVIKFIDYQKMVLSKEKEIAKNLGNNQRFNEEFNLYVENIAGALNNLSDKVVDKDNLKQKVNVSSKVKVNQYPQSMQLAYIESLAKLTNQVVTVGIKVNIDELINWHDQSFFRQVQEKNRVNFLQVGSVKIEKTVYSTLWWALSIFTMLVIMLAVLRIEQNTRKK